LVPGAIRTHGPKMSNLVILWQSAGCTVLLKMSLRMALIASSSRFMRRSKSARFAPNCPCVDDLRAPLYLAIRSRAGCA
jgi:hypothetical protein